MRKEELFELVDIEEGSEFEYFENYEALMDSDEEIECDELYMLLSEVELTVFSELTESWFYDIMENIPQDHIDLYNLLTVIRRNLIGLAQAAESEGDDSDVLRLSEEVEKFRNWYSIEDYAAYDDENGQTRYIPVRDALASVRAAKFGGEEHEFDFSNAMEYEIEEYIMTYGDMVNE